MNARNRYCQTPLYQAILSCPEAVDTLLRAGANPHLIAGPLEDAVRAYSHRAIGALVRAGADVNQRYHWDNGAIDTALHSVVRYKSALGPGARQPCALELVRHAGHLLNWDVRIEDGDTPLGWAEWMVDQHPDDQDVASIYELYKTRRLPPGAQLVARSCLNDDAKAVVDLKSTSLIKAGLAGNIQAIGHLITAGAMVNERDEDDRSLLHLVAMGLVPDSYSVALELVRYGGYGVDWDAMTKEGLTAEQLVHRTLSSLALDDKRREEASNVLSLLQQRALPEGVDYIYPCIHPDYCRECSIRPCTGYCSNTLRMPGAFD